MRRSHPLAGVEEEALRALLIGDFRSVVGRQLRQHFRLQGGKSREVRRQRGRHYLLLRSFHTISLFHRVASWIPLLLPKRIRAICNSRAPVLSARRIAMASGWFHGAPPPGSPKATGSSCARSD